MQWGDQTIDEQLRALSDAPLRRLPDELMGAISAFGAGLRRADPDMTVVDLTPASVQLKFSFSQSASHQTDCDTQKIINSDM